MTTEGSRRGAVWTRRALLGAGVAVLVGAVVRVWTGHGAAETERADALVATLRDPNAARRVGKQVLAQYPAWDDAARLRRALSAEIGDAGTLAKRLTQRMREDFEAGRVVLVDDWMLAQTEARLYALAALSR